MNQTDQNIAYDDTKNLLGWSTTTLLVSALIFGMVLFMIDLGLGSVKIPPLDVVKIIIGSSHDHELWEKIIFGIRMPKAVSAVLAGTGLAAAGLQMQTLFHNPLAGPSVLGITAGASLGVAMIMLTGGGVTSLYAISGLGLGGSWLIVLASAAGASIVLVFILLLSIRLRDNVSLLIIGIMVGNLTISMVSIWQYFSEPEQIQDYLMWTFGSLGGVTTSQMKIFGFVVVLGLLMTFLNSKILNTLLLGENYARSLGLNVFRARTFIIITTAILAGAVTGFCGPIAFIGIAVPHLSRTLLGTSNHRVLIPATILLGASLMLICDIIAQVPGSQIALPINAITALIGSPVVVWVIMKRRNLRMAF